MSETALSISFKDQLCFEAHCDYILNANHVPPQIPYLPRRDPDARAKVNLDLALLRTRLNSSCHRYNNAKGWRWVDFRPKHHTQAPRSPTVVFGGKALEQPYGQYRVGSGGQNQSRGTHRLLMTPSGKFDDGRYAEALNFVFSHDYGGQSGRGREGGARGKKRPLFRSGFRCSKPHDDRVERARERREFVVYPYTNPQPFDHRGVRRGVEEEWGRKSAEGGGGSRVRGSRYRTEKRGGNKEEERGDMRRREAERGREGEGRKVQTRKDDEKIQERKEQMKGNQCCMQKFRHARGGGGAYLGYGGGGDPRSPLNTALGMETISGPLCSWTWRPCETLSFEHV